MINSKYDLQKKVQKLHDLNAVNQLTRDESQEMYWEIESEAMEWLRETEQDELLDRYIKNNWKLNDLLYQVS